MPGKRYSAGAIFLQVVPVFGNVQRAIQDEAKNWERALGDEMEKSGSKAGERAGRSMAESMDREASKGAKESGKRAGDSYAGSFASSIKSAVRDANKEIEGLDFKTASERSLKNLELVKRELKSLNDLDFNVDFDEKRVLGKIAVINAALKSMRETQAKGGENRLFHDIDKTIGDLERVEKKVSEIVKRKRDLTIGAKFEPRQAERELGAFEKKARASFKRASEALGQSMSPEIRKIKAELDRLSDSDFDIDVTTAEARAKITELSVQLRELSLKSPEVDVKFNAGTALSEMAALRGVVGALDGKDIDIDVNTKGSFGAIVRDAERAANGLSLFKAKGDAASSTFRSFNPIVAALAALLPAIGPAAAAAAGGLLALGPAIAAITAGIGTMIFGFGGIGDAVKALGAQASAAGKDTNAAAKKIRTASYAVADAKRSLADAERSAAQAAEDAARAVKRARESAAQAIEDALDRQKEAQLSYADSVRDVQKAEQDLADARAEAEKDRRDIGTKIKENQLGIDQGLVDEFNAKVNYDAVMADGSSTNLDKEQARIAYEQAKLRMEELRNEQADLAADKAKYDKDGIDGSDKVQTAQERLTSAIEAQAKAQRELGKASDAVDRARIKGAREVQDALRAQARSSADNARSIKQAQEALRRAREGVAQAAIDTGEMASSQQKVEEAMAKLGPAGQGFARYIFSLRSGYYAFRDQIQGALLPAVQTAMERFFKVYGPASSKFLVGIAGAMGKLILAFERSLEGPGWKSFFHSMKDLGPSILMAFGSATIKGLAGFASLMGIAAPYAKIMGDALARIMGAFAGWAASAKGQEALQGFMQYAFEQGPKVVDLLVQFTRAIVDIFKALAPLGDDIIAGLTAAFEWIANLDPETLTRIAGAINGIVLGMQAAALVGSLILAVSAAFATALGSVIFTMGILIYNSETFRNALKDLAIWVIANKDHIMDLLSVIAPLALGFLAVNKAIKIWKATTALFRAIQLGFAAATYGAAGATYAQTGASKAAYVAGRLWNGVVRIARLYQQGLLWQTVKTNAVLGIMAIKTGLVSAATKVWAGVQAVFNAIMSMNPIALVIIAIIALVGAVIYAYTHFTWFHQLADKAMRGIATAASWLWGVLKPVFQAIWKAVKVLALVYFKVYFALISAIVKAAGNGIKSVWHKIISPAFDLISGGASKLWNKGIKPAWTAIKDGFTAIWTKIKGVWDDHLAPFFDKTVPPIINKFSGAFQTVVDAVKKIWDGLKEIVKAPIRFVIEKVINDGLIGGFNQIARWVGQKGFDPIKVPDVLQPQKKAKGGLLRFGGSGGYDTGGTLPGYTPGRDVHRFVSPTGGQLELSGGEAIMRPEWTAAMGSGYVDHMNSLAARGGVDAIRKAMSGQAFAKGGIFFPLPGGHYAPNYRNHDGVDINVGSGSDDYGMTFYSATSGKVASTGYGHGYGNAVFVNSPFGSLVYGHSIDGSIKVHSGQAVAPGTPLARVGQTGNASAPHLHFGHPGGTYDWAKSLLAGAPVGKAGKAEQDHPSIPGKILSFIKNPLGKVKGWVTGAWDHVSDSLKSNPVFDTLKRTPLHLVKMVTDKAWDVVPGWAKAAAGWAGEGAKWVVGGVKNAGEAVGDAASGAAHAVGDGAHAIGHALGFKDGGVLPYNGTMMYDNGGYLPPGLTSVVNLTGKPEPVFTADQFDGIGGTGKGGGIHYEPHFEGSDLTADDVAGDMMFAFRRISRGGKYEGVGL